MARSSTSFPAKWQNGTTTVIRVPAAIAKDVLAIARRIDAAEAFRVRDEPGGVLIELQDQPSVDYNTTDAINVARVPQRSPFRYPGGKTWLVPYIREWLKSKRRTPSRLIEPFAGGAVVSLTAAFERLAKHVVFGELDENVAAVWRVVLNGHAEWLAKQILKFEMSHANAKRILDAKPVDLSEKAFQTILRNRVQRGGIMAPGAGLLKAGENNRGLLSRWYPQTLAMRIREINQLKDRLSFVPGDGFDLIEEHKGDKDAVFYIDPPYTLAARRLYSAWQMDHSRLFALMSECKGDFLMSYDNTPEIASLAEKFGFESRAIAMKSTHHAAMTELLIGKNLRWLECKRSN